MGHLAHTHNFIFIFSIMQTLPRHCWTTFLDKQPEVHQNTLFLTSGNVVKHGFLCLINYFKLTQNCKAIGERDIQSPPYPTVTEGMGCARGVSSLPTENQSLTLAFNALSPLLN